MRNRNKTQTRLIRRTHNKCKWFRLSSNFDIILFSNVHSASHLWFFTFLNINVSSRCFCTMNSGFCFVLFFFCIRSLNVFGKLNQCHVVSLHNIRILWPTSLKFRFQRTQTFVLSQKIADENSGPSSNEEAHRKSRYNCNSPMTCKDKNTLNRLSTWYDSFSIMVWGAEIRWNIVSEINSAVEKQYMV